MTFRTPRFWLVTLLGLGALVVLYVIVAASVKPASLAPARFADPALLTGEVADFSFALQPQTGPDIPFEVDGASVRLKEFRGKVVLVNFWATWCEPCLRELPSLDQLEARLGGEDFAVVAIAADARGPEIARRFLDRLEIKRLKLYRDPMLRLTSAIGGANLPVSILYDRQGREIGRLVGEADWHSAEALALIENAIAASPR